MCGDLLRVQRKRQDCRWRFAAVTLEIRRVESRRVGKKREDKQGGAAEVK